VTVKQHKSKNLPTVRSDVTSVLALSDRLLGDIRSLIDGVRQRVAQAVNASLVMLYWSIGNRVREEIGG